jgi:hypothetical protein
MVGLVWSLVDEFWLDWFGSLVDEFWLDWFGHFWMNSGWTRLVTLMDEAFGDSSIPNRMECVLCCTFHSLSVLV